jgi:hypothetical protein
MVDPTESGWWAFLRIYTAVRRPHLRLTMFTIRKDQMEAFESEGRRRFEDEMLAHLKRFAPPACDLLGDDRTRKVIHFGFERAKRHGFTNRGPLRFYLELIFILGSDFDTDPLLPWVGRILSDPAEPDQMRRADLLHERTMEYVQAITGPDSKYEIAAMRRAVDQPLEVPVVGDRDFKEKTVDRLRAIYPEKCDYVGDAAIRALIPRGIRLARGYSVSSDFGTALFIGLMFALGHGFATDPKFPWIEAALTDPDLGDPDQRVHHVSTTVKTLFEHFLLLLHQD